MADPSLCIVAQDAKEVYLAGETYRYDPAHSLLALWTKRLDTGMATDRATVQKTLLHWQKDTGLAGFRDEAALARLHADEQKAFTQLWADVAALLKKAEEKTK